MFDASVVLRKISNDKGISSQLLFIFEIVLDQTIKVTRLNKQGELMTILYENLVFDFGLFNRKFENEFLFVSELMFKWV